MGAISSRLWAMISWSLFNAESVVWGGRILHRKVDGCRWQSNDLLRRNRWRMASPWEAGASLGVAPGLDWRGGAVASDGIRSAGWPGAGGFDCHSNLRPAARAVWYWSEGQMAESWGKEVGLGVA